ncbi:MAG: CDP-alcohol phosphatidyltransferase family protein [Clostridia bacterium]|nr:CDP-alcohol phosphatidyltransferase family protein [Clostridia bacterium]
MNPAKKPQILSLPNLMSFFRIALIPFILWASHLGKTILAALLLVISGLTDIVDGFVARRFHMITPLGKALDPLADKLTIGCVLLSLVIRHQGILSLLIVFGIKEFLMGVEGLLVIRATGTTYSAKWYGKISTLLLYATLFAFILWENMPPLLAFSLLLVCHLAAINAFVLYTLHNIRLIKETKRSVNYEKAN